jgi:hypothetical protein
MTLWDTAVTVDEFVVDGNPIHQAAFRTARTTIEGKFASLLVSLSDEPVARALITRALEGWNVAEALGAELTSILRPPTAPQTIELIGAV